MPAEKFLEDEEDSSELSPFDGSPVLGDAKGVLVVRETVSALRLHLLSRKPQRHKGSTCREGNLLGTLVTEKACPIIGVRKMERDEDSPPPQTFLFCMFCVVLNLSFLRPLGSQD